MTTSRYARDAEDESDAEVEGGRGRGRAAKAPRPKKITVTLKKQIVKKLALLAVPNKKGKGRKTAHYSKASISQQLL